MASSSKTFNGLATDSCRAQKTGVFARRGDNHTCHRKGGDRYYIFCRVDPN